MLWHIRSFVNYFYYRESMDGTKTDEYGRPPARKQAFMSIDTVFSQILLDKFESIAALSAEACQAIERLPIATQKFQAGRDIVNEGDKPSNCCFIIDGWAFRYKLLPEGKRQIFSFHLQGDIMDLQSLQLAAMDHSIAALTQATIGFVPHPAVRQLAAEHPTIAAILWRDALVDAASLRERMVGMGRRSAAGKLAHLLCDLYRKLEAVGLASEYCCDFPLNQQEIADTLGLSNVHVNRVLQSLRRDGLINLKRGVLKINRWDKLTQVSEYNPTYLDM